MDQRIKELFSNTLLFTIANMGSKILVFLMVPLYTTVLSTEEYGIADMVQTTSQMLFPVLTVMISEAVLRFCFIKEYNIKQTFSIGLRLSIIGSLICVAVSILLFHIPYFSSLGRYVLLIPLIFLSTSFMNLFHKFARGIDKVRVSAMAGLINTIIIIALNLLFLLVLKLGVLGYLLAYMCGELAASIYIAIRCKAWNYYSSSPNRALCSEMLMYSIPLVPNSISWWALSNFNRYIMLAVLGVSSVGIYSATLRIPSILTVLSDIFAQAWLLSALKNYGDNDSKIFIKSMYNSFFSLLVFITGLMIMLSHPFANILLSDSFSGYWYVSTFLFISVFFGALVGFLGSIFSAERKNTMQFISTIVGAFISILITLIFIKSHGVIVVAIATMLGYFIIWVIRIIAVKKYISIHQGFSLSIIQSLLLLGEAVLVCMERYVGASILFLLLIIINYKNASKIFLFLMKNVKSTIKRRTVQ